MGVFKNFMKIRILVKYVEYIKWEYGSGWSDMFGESLSIPIEYIGA